MDENEKDYWYCPFRKGCEEGESYCDWPCDKWAKWHDDQIRKNEREMVLNNIRTFAEAYSCHGESEKTWVSVLSLENHIDYLIGEEE